MCGFALPTSVIHRVLFEIALVFLRLDHIASVIVNANDRVIALKIAAAEH